MIFILSILCVCPVHRETIWYLAMFNEEGCQHGHPSHRGNYSAFHQMQLKFIACPLIKWRSSFTSCHYHILSGFAHSLDCYQWEVLPWLTHGRGQWVERSEVHMGSLTRSTSTVIAYQGQEPCKGRRQCQYPRVWSVWKAIIYLLPLPPTLHAFL